MAERRGSRTGDVVFCRKSVEGEESLESWGMMRNESAHRYLQVLVGYLRILIGESVN